jgi:hypothetical protein
MSWLFALAFAGVLGTSPAPAGSVSGPSASAIAASPALLSSEARRVRSSNARVTRLIAEGMRRSPTFADLVRRIHETNVIVYVEPTYRIPSEMCGRIAFSTQAGDQRYLRVQVLSTMPADAMIAVIGHELRHALEVAADPTVVNPRSLAAMYRRIGERSGERAFDTEAARVAGRVVRSELGS